MNQHFPRLASYGGSLTLTGHVDSSPFGFRSERSVILLGLFGGRRRTAPKCRGGDDRRPGVRGYWAAQEPASADAESRPLCAGGRSVLTLLCESGLRANPSKFAHGPLSL